MLILKSTVSLRRYCTVTARHKESFFIVVCFCPRGDKVRLRATIGAVWSVRNRIRTILAGPDDDGFVYSWAGYESLDVSYVKSSQTLKLKVRTLLVGGGVPRAYKDGEKHFDGYVACKTLPELRKWIEEKQFE